MWDRINASVPHVAQGDSFLFNVQEAPVAGSIWVGDQQKQKFLSLSAD